MWGAWTSTYCRNLEYSPYASIYLTVQKRKGEKNSKALVHWDSVKTPVTLGTVSAACQWHFQWSSFLECSRGPPFVAPHSKKGENQLHWAKWFETDTPLVITLYATYLFFRFSGLLYATTSLLIPTKWSQPYSPSLAKGSHPRAGVLVLAQSFQVILWMEVIFAIINTRK